MRKTRALLSKYEALTEVIRDELNVKQVIFVDMKVVGKNLKVYYDGKTNVEYAGSAIKNERIAIAAYEEFFYAKA